ncbi:hypothetical protein D8B45_02410, partial [Candidatus Gracilibacteria bacterium]
VKHVIPRRWDILSGNSFAAPIRIGSVESSIMTGSIPPNTASNFQDSKNIKKSTISVAVHTHIRIALIQKLS